MRYQADVLSRFEILVSAPQPPNALLHLVVGRVAHRLRRVGRMSGLHSGAQQLGRDIANEPSEVPVLTGGSVSVDANEPSEVPVLTGGSVSVDEPEVGGLLERCAA
jgi:hypothetical protein